jgi:hypothetical protein
MFPATPTTPPPLNEHVAISDEQKKKAKEALADLAEGLEGSAVLLIQGFTIITFAGALTDDNVATLAETADSIWIQGADRPAREVVRFENVVYLEKDERHNLALYSIHVVGGVVLVIGWPVEISLTQLRAEAHDTVARLRRIFEEE